MKVGFCTCGDHECPFNPVNHDKGCTPCIAKNLKAGEIPSCFFNSLDPEQKQNRGEYKWKDFARMVMEAEEEPAEETPMFSKTSALLIIDMQKAFVEPGAAHCIKGARATVPAIMELAAEARVAGAPVIWIKREYREDGSDVEFTRRDAWLAGGRTMAPGSTGINSAELAEGLKAEPEDYEIIKPRWSAFCQTELDLILRRLGVDTVVLAGTTTPNCIRTTCYDAIALDYNTIVAERCCSSQNDEIQKANMEDMERIGAVIVR